MTRDDMPEALADYSEECVDAFLETFNATDGDDSAKYDAAWAAAQECAGDPEDTDEAGAEPDCGCDHAEPVKGRKVLPLEDAKVDDTGSGEFEGYANVFGIVDDGGDKVLKGAFKPVIGDFLKSGFISWNHDWGTPVAMPVEATEDDHGLLIKAKFHSTPTAQDARRITQERIAAGLSVGLSIGYEVGEAKDVAAGRRDIKSFKRLFETGLVMVPMNRPSLVTAAKGSLGSGKPYAERLALVLAQATAIEGELKWLAAHSRTRADLRQKEGRVLSGTNRERITSLKESLRAVLRDLEELLSATDPDRGKAAQAALARSFLTLAGVNPERNP